MSNGRIVTIAWYPPLTPARQRVFNVILLTIIPALTLWSAIWAATLFPYQPRAHSYIDPWKLNEPIVRQSFGFDHQQYEAWLQEQ